MVEFDVHNIQKVKLVVHIVQAVLIVVSWIMDIVVMRGDGEIDGRLGWHFGVCFLSTIPLVYLTMVGRFPRTRKFANPYALAVVDFLFAVIWLSAFAAVANWNGTGKCKNRCGVSKGVVGLGVVLWLLWIATTMVSFYGLVYYRREGYLPGASRAPHNAQMIDPDKEAFSTAPHDDEYAPVHNTDDHELDHAPTYGAGLSNSGRNQYEDDAPSYRTDAPSYGGGYQPPQVHDENTGYAGAYTVPAPSNDVGGRVQFPTGRYDNV